MQNDLVGLDPIFKSEGVALKARQAIEEANNSLYGSHGFFLSLSGGEPDRFHLARPIEELKARSNRLYREGQEAAAEIKRLRGLVEEARASVMVIARQRLSTEGEVSDLVLRSPAEELRRAADATEQRDREIREARATLSRLEPQIEGEG